MDIPPEPIQPNQLEDVVCNGRAGARAVEQSFVGRGSIASYVGQLVRFIVYLYDFKREYIPDSHLQRMDVMNATDTEEYRVRPRKGGNKRKLLRDHIKEIIQKMERSDSDGHHNSPFKIDGEGPVLS